ncbi:MAG TPA: DUF3783 domain-containing protein [bacterium]|nr:DUF3783 domain-containing protein [bacterium]
METKADKVVVMHGMTQDEAVRTMRAVKAAMGVTNEIAFAMTTETNMTWKLADLVEHVLEEHSQMTAQKAP